MDPAPADALLQRYRKSLPDKAAELARAWEAWITAPASVEAKQGVQHLAHRLAGSAPLYGLDALGSCARSVDTALAAWEHEPAERRPALSALCLQLAPAIEALLTKLQGEAFGEPIVPAPPATPPRADDPIELVLVDDDEDQSALWAELLADEGFVVRTAATREALEAELAVGVPDALVIDFWLEPLTGPELVRLLADVPAFAAIPKICLTADTGPHASREAMDAGFTTVLRKGIDPADFASLVRDVVVNARNAR